jgi:ring-1,2-phenylacetyl-CoA epoxidase subunit PaaC
MVTTSYADPSALSADVAEAFIAWCVPLTDTKQALGLQFSHWVTGTPALEAAVGAAAITQDELGHARSLFALLKKFPNALQDIDEENDLRDRKQRYHPRALSDKWDSWLKLVAMSVTLDQVLHEVFLAARGSSLTPLAAIATKIDQEERYHRIFGDTFIERLGKESLNAQLQQQLNWAFPIAEVWLGPDGNLDTLVQAGILTRDDREIKQRWLDKLHHKLSAGGLSLPQTSPDWSRWNPTFRDLS